MFSSSIEKEVKVNPKLKSYFKPAPNFRHTNIIDEILPFVATLKRINLTGGEPLLIKENLALLELLLENGRKDVQLLITTNASVINPQITSLANQFNDVHWTVSIDGVGATAEYVRHGSVWDKESKNFEIILGFGHSVHVNTTVSAYSILDLARLCEWFNLCKLSHPSVPLEIMFSVVQNPKYLQPHSLPPNLIPIAKENLVQSIEILKTTKNNPEHCLNTLLNLLESLQSNLLHAGFVRFTKSLDEIRNQDFFNTFGVNYE